MTLLGIDLGATKLSFAVFSEDGTILTEETVPLRKRSGGEVGEMIVAGVCKCLDQQKLLRNEIAAIGICVPGIFNQQTGMVWAPNIPGWEAYPLQKEIQAIAVDVPVIIDSDRSCYILGEVWKGNAANCRNAIFIAVGTGIGAGIMVEGKVLRGSGDIAGAIGWMALEKPYKEKFTECGCFETKASGAGIVKCVKEKIAEAVDYNGILKTKLLEEQICTNDIFSAYSESDVIATKVVDECIELWGMAVANLVTIFNPEKIILGGGVFGPAVQLIAQITAEATKWAQPISMKQTTIKPSALGSGAGLYGSAWLALQTANKLHYV